MELINLSLETLTPLHSSLEIVEDQARISKIEKLDQDDTNSYVTVNNLTFQNGIIEVDVCGKLRKDAPGHARGFIGLVFRVNEDDNEFESFYIRPTNGRDCKGLLESYTPVNTLLFQDIHSVTLENLRSVNMKMQLILLL